MYIFCLSLALTLAPWRQCWPPTPCPAPHQVLAAAGAVDHDELVKLASSAFSTISDEDNTTSVRGLITKVFGRPGFG